MPDLMNGPTDPFGYGQHVPPVTQIGPITIGAVNVAHGELGRPVPEYIPTKYELLVLARHWATELAELLSWWEESGQVGSDELRQHEYFYQRLDAIAGLADSAPTIAERCVAALELLALADDTLGTASTAARKILAEAGGTTCPS